MKTRILKIEPIYRDRFAKGKTPPSYLRLKGFWLARLGFAPGDRVKIVESRGLLVIRKHRDSSLRSQPSE